MLAGIAKVLMTTRPTQTSVLESLESVAVSAVTLKARLAGLIVDKKEVGAPVRFAPKATSAHCCARAANGHAAAAPPSSVMSLRRSCSRETSDSLHVPHCLGEIIVIPAAMNASNAHPPPSDSKSYLSAGSSNAPLPGSAVSGA